MSRHFNKLLFEFGRGVNEPFSPRGQFRLSSFFAAENFKQARPHFDERRFDRRTTHLGQVMPGEFEQRRSLPRDEFIHQTVEQIEALLRAT